MKVLSSLSSAKRRHSACQVVKRKGTLYVICKTNPKFKARQGATQGTRLSTTGFKYARLIFFNFKTGDPRVVFSVFP